MYKFDTHFHTSEVSPCGKVRAAEGVELYKRAGYSGIVVTDHYYEAFFETLPDITWEEKVDRYLNGYRIAHKLGKKIGLKVLLGMEITFIDSPNDYLVFGVDEEFLKDNVELYKINLKRFKYLIENRDILIYQAHPFRPGLTPAHPDLLDGVEIFNGNPRHDSRNNLAYSFAKENDLKMLSGSDFHQPQDVGRGGIILNNEVSSEKEFVQSLMNNNIVDFIGDTIVNMLV